MKILHISHSDLSGGAAIGAYTLHQNLRDAGVDSQMLVQDKVSQSVTVIESSHSRFLSALRPHLDSIPVRLRNHGKHRPFSTGWLPDRILNKVREIAPDLINLHWIGAGTIRLETILQLPQPVVWTIRDMWPVTGGCFYNDGCDHYKSQCGHCPQMSSHRDNDLSRRTWKRKALIWERRDLTLVPISRWMADVVISSGVYQGQRIEVIHNALSKDGFSPRSPTDICTNLGLSPERKTIVFGAFSATTDPRKGYQLLQQALKELAISQPLLKLQLIVFGNTLEVGEFQDDLPVHGLSVIRDAEVLAQVYSAADVVVVPSTFESFGKTAMEALACETPVVCFDTSGLRDVVDHLQNGYLARCFETSDLAAGIHWVLENEERRRELGQNGRQKTLSAFGPLRQAESYQKLYCDLLS